MNSWGVYKKKLYKIFIPAGLAILLIISSLTGYFWSTQNKSNYLHYLSSTTTAMESASKVTMTVISKSISDVIRSQSLNAWSRSAVRSDYYFKAVKGIDELRSITTDSVMIDYELAVTTLYGKSFGDDSVHMVLTNTGSVDRDDYFLNRKQLSLQETSEIFTHFSNSGKPLVIPHYENGRLESLYYITMSSRKPSQLLCFVTIPAGVLTGTASGDFILYSADGILAYSNDSPEFKDEMDVLYQSLKGAVPGRQDNYLRFKDRYALLSSISSNAWEIAYVYDNFVFQPKQVAIFSGAMLVLLLVLFYVIYRLVELLYRPLQDVLGDSLPPGISDGQAIDEFKVLKQNNERILELNNALVQAVQENNRLSLQRCYRSLLFTPAPEPFTELLKTLPEGSYCVALLELGRPGADDPENSYLIMKGYILDFVSRRPHDICLDTDHRRMTLILHDLNEVQARQLLFSLLNDLEQQPPEDAAGLRIALSSCRQGCGRIHLCYQETLKIIEYKHLYTKRKVLTYDQIAAVDSVSYSYPLSMENRLVSCAAEGKEEALEVFDQLIRTNLLDKTLSVETTQSLVYALIGTLSRIIQELKTAPEEFLGYSLDFKHWYDSWSDAVTISQIRRTLSDIIASVGQRSQLEDTKLLQDMLAYIYENYNDDIMLIDMADHFNISPKYCGILFKQLSDQNFKDFLNRYRIEKAKELLNQDPGLQISKLSRMVGFNSSNSFIRVFGKYTGLTPKTYIRQQQDPGNV